MAQYQAGERVVIERPQWHNVYVVGGTVLVNVILVAVMAANWFQERSKQSWGYWRMVFTALLLFVVLNMITATPVLGWLIVLVLICLAFGALVCILPWKKSQASKYKET